MGRPKKLSKEEVLKCIQDALSKEKVFISDHANERMKERKISWFEVKEVLNKGHNERQKDEYKSEYKCWTYAIRFDICKSDSEKRKLRVPIAFDQDGTIVVSTIDLDQEEKF